MLVLAACGQGAGRLLAGLSRLWAGDQQEGFFRRAMLVVGLLFLAESSYLVVQHAPGAYDVIASGTINIQDTTKTGVPLPNQSATISGFSFAPTPTPHARAVSAKQLAGRAKAAAAKARAAQLAANALARSLTPVPLSSPLSTLLNPFPLFPPAFPLPPPTTTTTTPPPPPTTTTLPPPPPTTTTTVPPTTTIPPTTTTTVPPTTTTTTTTTAPPPPTTTTLTTLPPVTTTT
jgi:hypothetical protein